MFDLREAGEPLIYSGQIQVGDIAPLAEIGIRSIICNRPDDEAGAVASARLREAAEAAGMQFAYQPVLFSALGVADGERFAALLDSLPPPIFAFCRSGRRSAALWALARVKERGVDAVLEAARRSGTDLEEMRPLLTKIAQG